MALAGRALNAVPLPLVSREALLIARDPSVPLEIRLKISMEIFVSNATGQLTH